MTEEEYEEWQASHMSLTERAQQYWKRKYQKSYKFNGSITWNILKGLSFKAEAGYEWGFNETQKLVGTYNQQCLICRRTPTGRLDKRK